VSRVASHHASKASAKRETTVSTEIEVSEAVEFESITERRVKNLNVSRVLNIVCRELNQEFTTYLSLVDVTVAFVNDRHVFDEAPLHDVAALIDKYVDPSWPQGAAPSGANTDPRQHLAGIILAQITDVIDFQGNSHKFIEEVAAPTGGKYWRVRRQTDPSAKHPFYPSGNIPAEGIVLEARKHTVRTDSIIVDSLLGHGVALDTYALATQQETLRQLQNENTKVEAALEIVAGAETEKANLYHKLFEPDGRILGIQLGTARNEGSAAGGKD
jgi:hypothetical protein